MGAAQDRRGGPLVALGVVLGCWVAARVVMTAFGGLPAHAEMSGTQVSRFAVQQQAVPGPVPQRQPEMIGGALDKAYAPGETARSVPRFAPPPARQFEPFEPMQRGPRANLPPNTTALPVSVAASHQLMWMAALSRMPLPAGFAAAVSPRAATSPVPFYPAGTSRPGSPRWSADGWFLLRRGAGGSLAAGALPATYGASQAGAVLRYRIAPHSPHRPEAYLRLSSALNSPADKDAAVGLSARPVPKLPLRAMAELRVSDQSGSSRLRPAALVVTELAPFDLPHETRAEFYGQAGYVGGRNATAFADGQARLDKHIARLGKAELRAGAGAWAGAQKGAARLDAGPSAVLGLPVGTSGSARLGLDYRIRVAGDARPDSGLALTLSAGF